MQCTAVWGRPTCHSSGACGSGAVFGRSWCLLHDDPTRVLEKSLVWCQQLFFFPSSYLYPLQILCQPLQNFKQTPSIFFLHIQPYPFDLFLE